MKKSLTLCKERKTYLRNLSQKRGRKWTFSSEKNPLEVDERLETGAASAASVLVQQAAEIRSIADPCGFVRLVDQLVRISVQVVVLDKVLRVAELAKKRRIRLAGRRRPPSAPRSQQPEARVRVVASILALAVEIGQTQLSIDENQ